MQCSINTGLIMIMIIIIILILLPKVCQKLVRKWIEWNDHQSGQSTEMKLSCNKTELKRCSKTEMRWNKKLPSRSSPDRSVILRPRSTRNCCADPCIGPSDSTAMGWKRNRVPRSAYLAVLCSAAVSTTDPALLAAASKYDVANRQTAVMSHVILYYTVRHKKHTKIFLS